MASLKQTTSILDKLSDRISPVIRRLSDINQNVEGTAIQLLRIRRVVKPHYKQTNTRFPNQSVLGDFKEQAETYNTEILSNISIKYPFTNIETFVLKDQETLETSITGIDVNDVLPIIATLVFEGRYNQYDKDPISLVRGDKVIDCFFDEKQNACPIILEVGKTRGSYYGKNIVSKNIEMSIHRGKIPKDMLDIIEKYLSDITISKKEIRKGRF